MGSELTARIRMSVLTLRWEPLEDFEGRRDTVTSCCKKTPLAAVLSEGRCREMGPEAPGKR